MSDNTFSADNLTIFFVMLIVFLGAFLLGFLLALFLKRRHVLPAQADKDRREAEMARAEHQKITAQFLQTKAELKAVHQQQHQLQDRLNESIAPAEHELLRNEFSKLESKLEILKSAHSNLKAELEVCQSSQEQDTVVMSVADTPEKASLDFITDDIGIAPPSEHRVDDLKRINGIGPLIEQKLKAIGIYSFEQVSKLSEADIEAVTQAIAFFPGRITRDDWVGQAKELLG